MSITTEPRPCGEEQSKDVPCPREARIGFSITRPDRGMRGGPIRLTVWPDDREAPAKASLACKQHGIKLISDLLAVLVSEDEKLSVKRED